MIGKTKFPMESALSGRKVYDEYHLTEEQVLEYVQFYFANNYGLAAPRVKIEKSNVNNCSICVRVDLTPDIESIKEKPKNEAR